MRRVVITGTGAVTPIGESSNEFWEGLISGKNGIDLIHSFDTEGHPVHFAGEMSAFEPCKFMDPKTAKNNDRYVQMAIASSKQALDENIKNIKENEPDSDFRRFGVVWGSGVGGLNSLFSQHNVMQKKGPKRVSPYLIPMMISNLGAGIISIQYGLKGPNFNITSACASGLHAMGESYKLIKSGYADKMVTGASESAITPLAVAGFAACKALSRNNDNYKTACKPFDKNRDGFVIAEGGAAFLMETFESARKRDAEIFAEVIGYGANGDAFHITAPSENGEGAMECMKLALADAQIEPENVDYLNAHGTSTEINDRNETVAIKRVFGEHAYKLAISATKSQIGHTLGASGPLGALATIYCLRNNLSHPTINFSTKDPDCDLNYTFNEAQEHKLNIGLINSFGFGGHNACLILKKVDV
ncbi:beta-ketoacyl-ACP synthase II [Candidatus Riflebacteria bacterium]